MNFNKSVIASRLVGSSLAMPSNAISRRDPNIVTILLSESSVRLPIIVSRKGEEEEAVVRKRILERRKRSTKDGEF